MESRDDLKENLGENKGWSDTKVGYAKLVESDTSSDNSSEGSIYDGLGDGTSDGITTNLATNIGIKQDEAKGWPDTKVGYTKLDVDEDDQSELESEWGGSSKTTDEIGLGIGTQAHDVDVDDQSEWGGSKIQKSKEIAEENVTSYFAMGYDCGFGHGKLV